MGDIKNPFDFGTGSIDKDQWQRDIDNEQDAFIARYQNATSRKNGLLLRQAFQELRKRIANGDMLNRTADGLYQFGSALNREDEGMEEAYRRALGFMGDLARRQINTPQQAPQDEKKVYSPTLLNSRFIKSINPSGTFDISFWNGLDDAKRVAKLKAFIEEEKNNLKNYNGVENYDSLLNLELRMQAFLNTPDVENLNRLGFTKNYLSLILSDDASQTQPLTEGELLDALLALQLLERENLEKRDRINYGNNSQVVTYNFDTPRYDIQADIINQTKRLTPGLNLSGIPQTQNWNTNYTNQLKLYVLSSTQELSDYFNNFRVNYQSILSNKNNIPTLSRNLARLFATIPGKEQGTTLQVYDWSKYLTHLPNGGYMINGTLENNGRFLYYNPSKGILHTNIARMDLSTYDFLRDLALLKSGYMKDGGVIKGQNGLDFSTVALNTTLHTSLPELQEKSPKLKETSPREMTAADIAAISADIGSIVASFVPGYGTAASAVLGVGSTLSNFVSDVNDSNTSLGDALWNGAKGLGADAIGLVPGFGTGAKGWKIATRLAKLSTSILAGLNTLNLALNSPEIMNSFKKVLSLKVSDMDLLDWRNVQNGLSMLATAGRLGHGIAVHKGYKGQLKVNSQLTLNVKPEPKTKLDKAKAKLADYRDKFKGTGETYDYGGPNTLPWFHDANIYLWGANRSGFNLGLKNPYKVDMSTKLLLPPKPKGGTNPKSEKEEPKSTLPSDRGLVWNERTHSYVRTKEIGGILKALRNGGIIKGQWGIPGIQVSEDRPLFFTTPEAQEIQVPIDPSASTRINTRQTYNFGNATPTFFIDLDITQNKQDANRGTGLIRSRYSVPAPNGKTLLNYKSAMDALLNYYNTDSGKNIMGDVYNYYNTWKQTNPNGSYNDFITDYNGHVNNIRNKHLTKFALDSNGNPVHKVNETGWSDFNDEHYMLYPSYGKFTDKDGQAYDDYNKDQKDIFGESTWRRLPNSFNGDEMDELRRGFLKLGDNTSYIHMKDDGTLEIVEPPKQNVNGVVEGGKKDPVEKIDPWHTEFTSKFSNPIDPSLGIIAAKTAAGLIGNRNVYLNLLDEMPQAPLRDPLHRQLAIEGWQERIKNGQNQLADLRRILQMQQGTDQQTNFATALDAERVGRDIMDKAFLEDSGRQFETAQKLWNLKNEDTMYNIGVGDANRKSIADRARMMAQIRAAWRSGDSNIIMGSIADAGNWLMKKYQREQDLVDKAKEMSLGSIDQYAEQELANDTRFKTRWNQLKAKQTAGTLTDAERQEIEQMKANKMQEIRGSYAGKYYGLYHTPLFGGGLREIVLKDGGSLEKEKLRARGKDNDRYVSMIKDLRTTNYRRRRRR